MINPRTACILSIQLKIDTYRVTKKYVLMDKKVEVEACNAIQSANSLTEAKACWHDGTRKVAGRVVVLMGKGVISRASRWEVN